MNCELEMLRAHLELHLVHEVADAGEETRTLPVRLAHGQTAHDLPVGQVDAEQLLRQHVHDAAAHVHGEDLDVRRRRHREQVVDVGVQLRPVRRPVEHEHGRDGVGERLERGQVLARLVVPHEDRRVNRDPRAVDQWREAHRVRALHFCK